MNRNKSTFGAHGHRPGAASPIHNRLRPKRELMICLGWLRLFEAITAKETRGT